jgi:hypothetical protein
MSEEIDKWKASAPCHVMNGKHAVLDSVIHINDAEDCASTATWLEKVVEWLKARPVES